MVRAAGVRSVCDVGVLRLGARRRSTNSTRNRRHADELRHRQSKPGTTPEMWGSAEDWWAEQRHGHAGPWNVLGWRIGQAALRVQNAVGRHELEVVLVPPQTPFTCLVDGLSVARAIAWPARPTPAEVLNYQQSFVAVRRKDLKGDVLEFRPQAAYLKSITDQPVEKLEGLSRQCIEKAEQELFTIRRISP